MVMPFESVYCGTALAASDSSYELLRLARGTQRLLLALMVGSAAVEWERASDATLTDGDHPGIRSWP
jgi:hypothetical protein